MRKRERERATVRGCEGRGETEACAGLRGGAASPSVTTWGKSRCVVCCVDRGAEAHQPSQVVMQYCSWLASSSAERVCGVAEASCHGSSDQFMKKMRELLGKAPDRGRAPPKRPLKTPLARRPVAPVPLPKR